MYNYKKKLQGFAITKMKKMRSEGISIDQLAKEFGVAKNTVQYHTSEIYKKGSRRRATKWRMNNKDKTNKGNRDWRHSHPSSFHKSVCLSTIRMRLKDGSVTKDDLFNVMSEFE